MQSAVRSVGRHGGDDSVVRSLSRGVQIRVIRWAQVKAGATVLENEACTGWDNTTPKIIRHAVDERTGVAFLIHHTKVDCIASLGDSRRVTWFRYLG